MMGRRILLFEIEALRVMFKNCGVTDLLGSFDASQLNVEERCHTYRGQVTRFYKDELSSLPRIAERVLDGASLELNGDIVVGFVAYLQDGYLETLEGFTFGEEWPDVVRAFRAL